MVKYIIHKDKYIVNDFDYIHQTAMHIIAINGHIELAKILIRNINILLKRNKYRYRCQGLRR